MFNVSFAQSTSASSKKYTYEEEYTLFINARGLPSIHGGPFVPQHIYKPHTTSDRKRYVEECALECPLYFAVQDPDEFGIPLSDALHSRVKRLSDREKPVFEGRGPSVSIRLEVSHQTISSSIENSTLQNFLVAGIPTVDPPDSYKGFQKSARTHHDGQTRKEHREMCPALY